MQWIVSATSSDPGDWVEVVSALGTAGAAIIALAFGVTELWRRRRDERALAGLWGTAFELRIAAAIATLERAASTAQQCALVDPTPELLNQVAHWVSQTRAAFSDDDIERLAKGLPQAAQHLAAAMAAIHIGANLSGALLHFSGPEHFARRGEDSARVVAMLSRAWEHLEEARKLCGQHGAFLVRGMDPPAAQPPAGR